MSEARLLLTKSYSLDVMFHLNSPKKEDIRKTASEVQSVSFYGHSNMADNELRTKHQVKLTAIET